MTDIQSHPKQGPVIAIDGPAGTGKSSVTKRLAESLSFTHVDTGAIYRSIAFLLIDRGIGRDEAGEFVVNEEVARAAAETARTAQLEFRRMKTRKPANRIFANGKDITPFIRSSEVSMAASKVSAIPDVRAALLGLQRKLGCAGKTLLEGRDIGTVVFPDADVKFFLTATVEERAKRRLAELEATGDDPPSFEDVKRQIAQRDHQDSTRAVAPLKRADDAIDVDTSRMTLDEVVAHMEGIARAKLGISKTS